MWFSKQEYWSMLPWPIPRNLPDPEIQLHLLCFLQWQMCSLLLVPPWKLSLHRYSFPVVLHYRYSGPPRVSGNAMQEMKICLFDPWVWKILWRRARQPTPVFLPGESHGQMVHKVTKSQTRLKQLSTHTVTDAFSRLYQLLFSKSSVSSSYHFLISPEFLLHFHSVSYPEPVVFYSNNSSSFTTW